jgi:hypothetical protein
MLLMTPRVTLAANGSVSIRRQDARWRSRYFDETIDPATIDPRRFIDEQKDKIMSLSMDVMALRDELDGDEEYKA